jgi:aspartyl-tRNA(Asn)/glutamyl-tRNA(Gln) amidotransferase subunit C
MEVNEALIDRLAILSRLYFNEGEKKAIQEDLQSMISFVDKLNELNTFGVQPQMQMSSEINALRKDELIGTISREEAFKNAPASFNNFFTVPKVINK